MYLCNNCLNIQTFEKCSREDLCGETLQVDDGLIFIISEFKKLFRNNKKLISLDTIACCEGHISLENIKSIDIPQCYILFSYKNKQSSEYFIDKIKFNLFHIKHKYHSWFKNNVMEESELLLSKNVISLSYSLLSINNESSIKIFTEFKADFQNLCWNIIFDIKRDS